MAWRHNNIILNMTPAPKKKFNWINQQKFDEIRNNTKKKLSIWCEIFALQFI